MRGIAKGILLMALIGIAGCARQKEVVVAEVAGRKITAQDLVELAGKLPSFTKDKLLWTLIDREIMVQEAYERGLNNDENILRRLERIKLIEIARLLKEKFRERIEIPEEDVRRYYEEKGLASRQEVRARHIMVRTEEEAEEILKKLKEGADFAQLAKEWSLDRVSAEKGGDLGYWREGEVIGATAQKVFSMEVGEISEPFRDPQGYYHVIEVLDRRPVGFETQKPTIVNRLKVQKLEGVYREYMEGLKEELGLKVEPDVADWLIERLRELGGELEGFSDEERRKVLVRYDEEEVSLGEYLKWLASLRPGPRRLSDSSWVARSVERFTLDNILVPHAAHREEIDRSEWLRSHLKKRLEDMMITELKRQEVDRKVINPEAVRKYYESHKDIYYRRPPRVLIRGILLDSLRWAQEAYEKVRAGASMAEVAGDYPPFHGKYRNYDQFTLDITEESEKHMGVPLIELVSRAEIGKINEPIRLSFVRDGRLLTGYAVVRVLKREPAGFEPLETPWVLRDIERKIGIVESKRLRELYNQWLTELRVKYNDKITIYQDRLKAVELAEPRARPALGTLPQAEKG